MVKNRFSTTTFGLVLLTVILTLSFLTACSKQNQSTEKEVHTKLNIGHYSCPMHPQIQQDHTGDCPICEMKLEPVYKR